MNRSRVICLLLSSALFLGGTPAAALSTVCSDPARAGVKGRMSVDLPSGGAARLEKQISAIAQTRLGMSVSGVSSEDPGEKPILRTSSLILQSPDVSVAITIRTSNRSNRARIEVERTCIQDKQVPWQPYWRALDEFLRSSGYRIHGG